MAGPGKLVQHDGTQRQPILVDEDQDAPRSGIGFEVEQLVRQVRKGDARFDPIDLDGEDDSLFEDPWRADEDSYDNDNAKIEREELANELEETTLDGPCLHWRKAVRNPCPCGTHHKVPKITIDSMELHESQVVELKEQVRVGRYGAEFIEIYEIWIPNKGDHIFVRGRTYARTRNLEGRIEPRQNEVCEIFELDENDHRGTDSTCHLEQALVEILVQDIKATRTLHKTNKAFPDCRFDRLRYRTKEERENEAPLTCRWQMVLSYPDQRYRRQQRPIAGELIRHYNQDDITKDRHRIPDSQRRKTHTKVRGGSFIPNGTCEDGLPAEASPIHLAPGQKYTVVDIFSGAGGYSKGAEMAGLKVLAACDHWPRCCETYRQNFPDTELHQEDVYRFIEDMSTDLTRERLDVDILHFSPPCQTWSPAHTCEGKKDEENRATLFACEKIITIFKPRIFTVEQTFGLAQERWIPNFNALLQGFTRHGYSVRWKVLHLVEYGLPQTRKRLVMIGAAPGEQLPAWPKPTHSKDPKDGQKPFVSAFKACSSLIEGQNLHDVGGARPTNKVPWDSSKPLGRTITTSGGQSYHHSGLREYTLGELAVLQGFPISFKFMGKCIKKQIGNAFAPIVVKALLRHLRVHLESFDGVTRQPPQDQVIILSEDKDDDRSDKAQEPEYKDGSHIQDEGRSLVNVLVGSGRKSSHMRRELLQGMVDDFGKNSVQCYLKKEEKESSKRGSSSGLNLQKFSRLSNSQAQPPHRHTTDSDCVLGNNPFSPTPASTVFIGENNVVPVTTGHPGADSGGDLCAGLLLAGPQNNSTAARDFTASTSGTPFQSSSTTRSDTSTHTKNFVRSISRSFNDTVITHCPKTSSELDRLQEPPLKPADKMSNPEPSDGDTRSTCPPEEAQNRRMTIVNGVLLAPSRRVELVPDRADRRSGNSARSIADLNRGPALNHPASIQSTGHQNAQNAQTLAGLDQPPSTSHQSSSNNTTIRRAGPALQIIDGHLIAAPRRQSPPDFSAILPFSQHITEATHTSHNQEEIKDPSLISAFVAASQALGEVEDTAKSSSLFGDLIGTLRTHAPQTASAPAERNNSAINITGVFRARRDSSRTEAGMRSQSAGAGEHTVAPGSLGNATSHQEPPHQQGPAARSSLPAGSFNSSTRETGVCAASRRPSQGIQTGDGAPGSSRVWSGDDSIVHIGESSHPGARRSLPIIIDDCEVEGSGGSDDQDGLHDGVVTNNASNDELADDNDEQLQHVLWESRAAAPTVDDTATATIADRRQRALDLQRQMLAEYRPTQDNGAPAPETDGPDDPKGKGKAVKTRKFDDFAEDHAADGKGKQNKRARGSE